MEEDRVDHEDEQHWRVRGDVVRDGVLEALLATAAKGNKREITAQQESYIQTFSLQNNYSFEVNNWWKSLAEQQA